MDLGKFKYEKAKKAKEAKKKQHIIKLKEIKLRPKTDEHDYQIKMSHVREFLKKGDRVKITIVFRGREMTHLEFGRQLMGRIRTEMTDVAQMEIDGRMDGKRMTSILIPGSKQKVKPQEPPPDPSPVTEIETVQ
jgi:translation initiation factor IF-3